MGDSVKQLERDVEAARAKLAGDLAVLRSPGTFSDMTEALRQAALEKGGAMIDEAKSRGRSAIADVIESVKEKAVANPAAVLVIGAGLAWHLVRRPPVALALIGGGLFGLLRTNVAETVAGEAGDTLSRARENLKEQTQALASKAGEAGRHAAHIAREKATELADEAGDTVSRLAEEAGDRTSHFIDKAKEKASDLADGAREALANTPLGRFSDDADDLLDDDLLDEEYEDFLDDDHAPERGAGIVRADTMLIGVSGLLLGAALATLYQKRGADIADDAGIED